MNTNHNNAPPHDEADAHLDANLRALGARIGPIPASATTKLPTLQLTSDPAPARRLPRSRWLAWGTAIAACIAAGAVILVQPWGNSVQASTIISTLRSKEFGGLNIRFDHVSSHGTTVDGLVRMRLQHPISIDQLDNPRTLDAEGRLGNAYGKFSLTTDGTVPGWAGTTIEAEGALTPTSGWMYVHASDQAADQMAAANPLAAPLAGMTRHGVVLNVGGLDESFFEGLNTMICPASRDASAPGLHASVDRTPDGRGTVSIGMGAGVPGNPSAAQMQRFASLARMVLSGKARQGELQQMQSMLQNDFAQKATVQTLGAGRFLLTTDLPDPQQSGAKGATLRVLYEQSGGVLWAEVSNMPDATGTIRIDFDADPIEPHLLAYERLVDTGRTNYLDLRMVMRLFAPSLIRLW